MPNQKVRPKFQDLVTAIFLMLALGRTVYSFGMENKKDCELPGEAPWSSEAQKTLLKPFNLEPKSNLNSIQQKRHGPRADHEEYSVNVEYGGHPYSIRANRFSASITPSKGTVVVLCGGPSDCQDSRPSNIPADFDVVISDPVGTGENSINSLPMEAMSVEGQALAIRKIVSFLKLKNYLFYGTSFGTAVATIASAELAKERLASQPKAVILEGISGARKISSTNGFFRTSNRAMEFLSREERDKFKNSIFGSV